MKPHKCKFRVWAWTGGKGRMIAKFRCVEKGCSEERDRLLTKAENREYDRLHEKGDVHTVYHDFLRVFRDGEAWNFEGAELADLVEKWAEKWPGEVRFAHCDDTYFSSSDLVLIEHRSKSNYMGTTVIFLPQCSGDPPAEFFLYPGHRKSLMEALKEVDRQAKPLQDMAWKLTKKRVRWGSRLRLEGKK